MRRIGRPLFALVLLAAGCGAQLGDGPEQATSTDANTGGGGGNGTGGGNGNGSGSGSGSGTHMDAGTSNACANGRKVYLNFDGVTVTQATPSDSTQNKVSWISAGATIPRYQDGSGTRTADIATIVSGVKSRLAMTPIEVVTTRPATGPYVMIIFGGKRTSDGGTVGTNYSYATNEHDCGDLVKNDVGWVSDAPSISYAQDLAIGAIGWGLGLNGTTNGDDCMAGWANNTNSNSGACTLSASIATTTSNSPATTCPNQNPQNEVAAFSTGFCN